jgi:DNA-binding transcriptional regulator PaaX
MSLADDILTILLDYSAGYKRMRQMIYSPGYDRVKRAKHDSDILYATTARLKKLGLIKKNSNGWQITLKGKEYIKQKLAKFLPQHKSYSKDDKIKKKDRMIIAFDIPESQRRKRDWLRVELILLDFKPIQKSVWLGPAPLPEDFIQALNELKILKHLKFFRVYEREIV